MFKKIAAAVAVAVLASAPTAHAVSSFSAAQSINADIEGSTIVVSYDTAIGVYNLNTVFSSGSFPYSLSSFGATLLGTYDIGSATFTDIIVVGSYTL